MLKEIGWTGFATPRLRQRYSVVTTGLIVGVMWGAWHLLQGLWVGGTYAGSLPVAVFVSVNFFIGVAQLTAYRVLMLWVYDATDSLLVARLMHASLTASIVFVFAPVAATGVTSLIHGAVLAGAMWIVVAAIAWAGGGHLVGGRSRGERRDRGRPLRGRREGTRRSGIAAAQTLRRTEGGST